MKKLVFMLGFCFGVSGIANAGLDEGLAALKAEDYSTAFKELLPLAEAGEPAAQSGVGSMYEWGKGTEKNTDRAFSYYLKSARQGFAEAQLALGTAYYSGVGVEKDISQAIVWWQKAADQGAPRAAHNLALMYSYGTGVPQDYQRAVSYYRKAIEAGLWASVFNLGVIYASGAPGVQKDLVMSYVVFSVASPNDFASAGHRGIVQTRMNPDQLKKAKELSANLKLGSRLPTETN